MIQRLRDDEGQGLEWSSMTEVTDRVYVCRLQSIAVKHSLKS